MDELERQYRQEKRDSYHFEQWLSMGMERGWVTSPFCAGHDEPPITEFEFRQFEGGDAPCVIMVRLLLYHDGPRYEERIDHTDERRPE